MTHYSPVDYLVIGHITQDLLKDGTTVIGGTVSYSGLTANHLGLKTGIVSTGNFDTPPAELSDIQTHISSCEYNSVFENINTPAGRLQYLHQKAAPITRNMIPSIWESAPIVHLGPLINEIEPAMALTFPNSLVALTPQGWMRKENEQNKIIKTPWIVEKAVLNRVDCIIFSIEDVDGNETYIDSLVPECKLLIVTESSSGARVYWNGDMKYFKAHDYQEIDPTGAGDIFTTSFLVHYYNTQDVWNSVFFATKIASKSVTRRGLSSVPTLEEARLANQEAL